MMKLAIATLLAGSAAAFAPATGRSSTSVALSAEKSASLPFLNRPALVSYECCRRNVVVGRSSLYLFALQSSEREMLLV